MSRWIGCSIQYPDVRGVWFLLAFHPFGRNNAYTTTIQLGCDVPLLLGFGCRHTVLRLIPSQSYRNRSVIKPALLVPSHQHK